MSEEERSRRVEQEEEPGRGGEAGRGQGMVEQGDTGQGMVGKLDRWVDRVAETMTDDSGESVEIEGRGVSPKAPATPETGEGATIELDSDAARSLRAGDELAVRLPGGGAGAWSYAVEGDEDVLDVSQRAEVVSAGGRHEQAPGASGGSQFLVRASRPGTATVRFEPVRGAGGSDDGATPTASLQLRVEVAR
jgi:hypothetical protein